MESFATPYSVIFYDGEQEHDKGHVGVHSVLTFKRFQAIMSQKTGIPAYQLSSVFVCRRTLKDTEKRQKLPINENTNFNIILNQHNPSRERDCHFLVSMKKSKKERKVTRKRSAEAENADDEDSNSSRGDLSPSDERPKTGSADETFSPEATSPPSFMQRPSSPSAIPVGNGNKPRPGSGSPPGKMTLGGDFKVERTLLRREGVGQNGFASPRSGWANGVSSQRVEGFNVLSGGGKAEGHTLQTSNGSALQQEDRRNLEKHWSQSGAIQEDGSFRQSEKANGHSSGHPQLHHSSGLDVIHQDRFNDANPQGNGARHASAILARNGSAKDFSVSPVLQRSSSMSSASNASRSTLSPLSSTATGNFIPRVSMGGLAAVAAGTNGGLTLQQAQAHISHLQQQHQTPLPGPMGPLELSKLNGMLRGLVARDSRGENTKICKFCCFLRERNMGPPPFHWCVDDAITKGFRGPSPAGPIGRPVKRHVEAAA
ncbi:hypothetical protein MPTK1_5g09620 [Marchantia polymorpha subsp. ruderalis]|uniref:DUF7138 domain-containing protein n=2 Tax=Marchantia polymorpha TaxID=3197 RepID=A0AAF6BGN2_MARPO|nr:hypothetical protein MARPO_0048s0108 [Marchantia polymorpha]BBN11166.1 hypothetical protein Mp_5g09620 [Marchantia polymorpha subsp. ruderalis]|eukprot:PTQ39006.1 hypothetical protein MARPO_0048s0108 [Marchantia polymorpha]